MARLVGVDLPREKRLEVALTYIFGIGRTRAAETLAATGISGDLRVHQLTDEHLVALRDHIEGTSVAPLPPISAARSRSATTRAAVTAAVSRCVASAPGRMRAPARARRRPWPARRRHADPRGELRQEI